MDHTQFTQAYVKTAIKEQSKLYVSYDCSNNYSACYTLLDSLDPSFKQYIKDYLPDNVCLLIVWMQVIKALHTNSLKCFKTMKCKLEKIKPQQFPGQNVADMSLDMTYHCQALTTAGICNHQLCLTILYTFLLTNCNELYCHSLINMKVILEDKLRMVRFMEPTAGITHLCSNGLTSADICDLAKTQYQEAKGGCKWPPAKPRTQRHCPLLAENAV